jgi:hypothetical protein
MEQQQAFDPANYLITVNGADYLEVKWRLVWLRTVHPDAVLQTELVSHQDNRAIFKATVTLPGGAAASGFGSEAYEHFPEYIEAAETKAIGRALAAAGFGSQFCSDFILAESAGILADAPVKPVAPRQHGETQPAVNIEQPMTNKQYNLIQIRARDNNLSGEDLDEFSTKVTGSPVADLSRRGASNLIDALQARRDRAEAAQAS